ncbi:choice-of-anchor I domain-containing protein [Leucobacter soli]|uniref:choice-of-anchor I domain-containing protein n=1 Tax=Leucobacter soli TaxID=2812850 RepID=UPI003616D185
MGQLRRAAAREGSGQVRRPPLCAGSPLTGKLTDADLGRLNISIADGLNEAGTCYEELHAFGGRSFSIWQTDGTQVFDSGSQFEEITNAANPNFVNSNHTENNKEGRSDDKGPEPENMAVGKVGDKTYAFIGLERVGGIMVYDISDPANSEFVTYVNNRDFSQAPGTPASGDQGAEGVAFIPAEKSATGRPLVAVGNEVSGTTTLFEVDDLKAEIDILTINDFHGRIDASGLGGNGEVGAGGLAGAVDTKRADNPNTLFVSAGDNIGASTFPSFINDDTPTIDALREAGLDLSVVGNHEFDRGLADLKTRVLKRYGGSEFGLGANVYYKGTQTPALDEYAVKTIDGVRVAFIGVVTRQTAAMVTPTGVAGIDFGDQVVAANRVAQEIEDEDLADVTVLLTHDGSAVDTCSTIATEDTDFGELVRGASADIDAIVSAHTHQKYACEIAGPGGENRPVIQAHQYGTTLGRLSLTYDRATDTIESITGSLEALAEKPAGSSSFAQKYPANTAVQTIVDAAVAEADVKGAVQVGTISGDITRGGTAGSDRGVESTAGNTVADIYLWATSNDAYAGKKAQIGIMNPGGLRADMLKGADGTVTYRAAADVQPFANTLVTVDLTGAQLKSVLEEQWQPEGWSRPKLHLGISEGLSYYYDEARAKGDRIIQIRFAGEKVADSDVFTVVTNSFVAVGGDNFFTFPEGANHTDTGQVDLAATVEFFEAHDVVDPSPLGRAIAGEPEPEPDPELIDSTVLVKAAKSSTRYGQANSATVTVKADGKAASGAVQVSLSGKTVVKSAKLSSTGRVTVKLPANTKPGTRTLAVKYLGTDAVEAGKASTKVKVSKAKPTVTGKLAKSSISRTKNGKVAVTVKLPGASGVYATGKVRILDGGKTLKTVTLKAGHKGKVSVTLPKLKKGTHKISVKVLGSSTLNSVTSKQVKLRVS